MKINLDDLIWVELKDPEDFLKVRETLTRIGIASHNSKTLYQSCHILHKKGQYAIVHFKEMLALDGKKTDYSDEDKARRNLIANLLHEWGLVKLVDPAKSSNSEFNNFSNQKIKVVSFKEKSEWELVPKYTIGKKFNKGNTE